MAATKKNAKAAEDKVLTIEIPTIQLASFKLTVVGDSPLIMHKWSEKAKKEILDKQTKKASKGKEKKNPVRDYVNSMYWLDDSGRVVDGPEVNDTKQMKKGLRNTSAFKKLHRDPGMVSRHARLRAVLLMPDISRAISPRKPQHEVRSIFWKNMSKLKGLLRFVRTW